MKSRAQLILATCGLTVLIWIYADLISQEAYEATLSVKLSVPTASEAVIQVAGAPGASEGGWETTVTVPVTTNLVGSKGAIAEIEHLKRTNALVIEVTVTDTEPQPADVLKRIDIRQRVSEWARKNSLRVFDLSPSFIDLKEDRYVSIDLAVEASAGVFADKLQGPPRVEPAKVRARLLASERDRLAPADRKLQISIEEQLRTGSQEAFTVSLAGRRWQGLEVTCVPDQVRVTVQRRHDLITHRITSVPLYELWPAYRPDQGLFHIDYEDGESPLQHIEVAVPPGTRLPTNTDVVAYVKVEPDDLKQASQDKAAETAPAGSAGTRTAIPREVKFIFSQEFEGVTVISPTPIVRLRIVQADAPAAAP
ncbi:MAG TPA: hypothetical protein VLM89_04000 [Phycisphaerae bacterium]|nr:hypothetical protein [Phycisphaerae bacterium]